MDQDTSKSKRIRESLSQINGIASENSSNSVKEVVLGTVVVTTSVEASSIGRENRLGIVVDEVQTIHSTCNSGLIDENSSNSVDEISMEIVVVRNSEQNMSFDGEKGGSELKIDEKGLSDTVENASETCNRKGISERRGHTDPGNSGNSSTLVEAVVLETVTEVNSDPTACLIIENRQLEAKMKELGSSKALVENLKVKVSIAEKESHVIDVKCGSGDGKDFKESSDGERVCRICHLTSEQSSETAASTHAVSTTNVELIWLGCGCKDELGIAHSHCAEAWFKLRGNRLCEICGQTAKNVTSVVGDSRFMEEWNEDRFIGSSSSSERDGCWWGKPFCNFLMVCLVIAFVVPWFFRVNMF